VSFFRPSRLALIGSLIFAAAIRIYGIHYAPTAPRARPDEEIIITRGFDLADGHDHADEIFNSGWPEGIFRVANFCERAEAKVLAMLFRQPVNPACLYAFNPGAIELPIRLVSALADVLSCLLGALMVRSLSRKGDETMAVMAGALAFGCNYLLARNAHFGVSDSLLTFFCTLCLYFGVRAAREGPRWLPLAGAAAGAGFGIKYAAIAMFGTCLAAALACLGRPSNRFGRWLACGLLAVGAAFAAFWVISPSAFGHFKAFWGGVMGHGYRYDDGARGHLLDPSYQIPPGWKFHLFTNLPIAFGALGLILAFLGLLLCLVRERRAGLVLWGSALTALAMLVPIKAQFVRYAAPMIPALAVGLGDLLAQLAGWARVRLRPLSIASAAAVAGLALVPPLVTTLQFDHLMAQPDTRDLASRWLLQHDVKTGAVSEGWYAQTQLIEPGAAAACVPEVPAALNPGVPFLPKGSNAWKEAVDRGPAGWGALGHDAIDHYIWGSPGRGGASYVVVGQSYLPCGKMGHAEDHGKLTPDCFQLVEEIYPGRMSCDSTIDLFDAFYLPYAGFKGLALPGPQIDIYEHTCVNGSAKKAGPRALLAPQPGRAK
jgi:hypothetical protein